MEIVMAGTLGRKAIVELKSSTLTASSPRSENGALKIVTASEHVTVDSLELLPRKPVFIDSSAAIRQGGISVSCELLLHPAHRRSYDFFIRWGFRDEAISWADWEILPREILHIGGGRYRLASSVCPGRTGAVELTVYAREASTGDVVWLGQPGENLSCDFSFETDFYSNASSLSRSPTNRRYQKSEVLSSVTSLGGFRRFLRQHIAAGDDRLLPYELYAATYADADAREKVSSLLADAHDALLGRTEAATRLQLEQAIRSIVSIGIGEVVLISPEGPHATAGGLGQVITGLLRSLKKNRVGATLIAPLYEDEQGNKHKSAADVLAEGIRINGSTVPLVSVGDVKVQFGGTHGWGSEQAFRLPLTTRLEVYRAECESVRVFLLRHHRLSEALYSGAWADEQLRRSLALSRGAIELMLDPRFEISPRIVVTNDWMTGLVPALLQTDPRYTTHPLLSRAATIHMLHNGGRDYQGRIPLNHNGEDLFPLLGIEPEHCFGLMDPHDYTLMNMTAGAVRHTRSALLTVSKPYATQLVQPEGGDGLERLFQEKRHMLFGISNGIDVEEIHRTFWDLNRMARKELELPAMRRQGRTPKQMFRSLPRMKRILKSSVQRSYGLKDNEKAVLLSFVGRLAEQKGLALLVSKLKGGISVLEAVLQREPNAQILICGPGSEHEGVVRSLALEVLRLQQKYPQRIAAKYQFVPHREALRITKASDLFLMPSRYEPGGITQLESLVAGTPVIARNVGGLAATLRDYSEHEPGGNAFLFDDYTAEALYGAIARGLTVASDPKRFKKLYLLAALSEHDWENRVPKYMALLQYVSGVFTPGHEYPHLVETAALVDSLRA
ncbi:MAG: glycogen/starch synthase [Deltaproteobacteria bacterium]|nr:glycogen/starch synthase [Deltaproteobacteria bacterium]